MDQMMFRWIPDIAAMAPRHTAVHFEGTDISYAAFGARIEGLACGLNGLGLGPGDRLAHMGLNSPDVLALLFACARIGAIFVPLNWRLAAPEIVQLLANATPKAVVADPEFMPVLETAGGQWLRLSTAEGIADWSPLPIAAGRAAAPGDPNQPVLICYTSGTTGNPRGAVLSQAAIRACALNAVEAYALGESDDILNVLPLFHVGGLNIQCLPALAVGATVTLHRRFDPGLALQDIAVRRITQLIAVPAMVAALLEHPAWKTTDLSCLRCLTTGSSTVPPTMIEAIAARGVPVGQVYGTTETGPTAIVLRAADAPNKPGSCGTPALLCAIRLIDDAGADVGDGASGEILVRGPNVMSGYWNDPAATAEVLHDGWFRTGDVAMRDSDGFYFVRDRKTNVIISGGENIYPAELEAVLAACPDIAEAVVVGRSDPRWVEVPVAYVVARHTMTREQVLALFDGKLARYKHPRDVVFLDALPRNAMGKVQKFRLQGADIKLREGQ
jgi:fatty-acyl-CoA synthase